MMRFFKLSLPENVDNPNTWASSVHHVFEGMPDHLCWVEFRGREQQALHDMGHDYPMEFLAAVASGIVSQSLFKESILSAATAVVAGLLAYFFVVRRRAKSLEALTNQQEERLNDMYYRIFEGIMNRSRSMNLYGRMFPLPDVNSVKPPTFRACYSPFFGVRVLSPKEDL